MNEIDKKELFESIVEELNEQIKNDIIESVKHIYLTQNRHRKQLQSYRNGEIIIEMLEKLGYEFLSDEIYEEIQSKFN